MISTPLGVVLVAYKSADVILDCLETLFASAMTDRVSLRVIVVDNSSPDDGVATIQAWASGATPYAPPEDLPFPHIPVQKPLLSEKLEIVAAGINGGFAAGVNIGLRHLFADPTIDRVWVLNPDSVVPPGTSAAFAHFPSPFALIGGRVLYYDTPDLIQIDGGTLNRYTGVTGNINLGCPQRTHDLPEAHSLAFITGASMVVSRAHWIHAGPMPEDYFLYYEEVDWALRRGSLPLAVAAEAIVYHRAGTAIGSPTLGRPSSPFSLYFKHRARMRFVRRYLPRSFLTAWAYTLAKASQYRLKGWHKEAAAVMAGARDAPPPPAVSNCLTPESLALVVSGQAAPASASALSAASAVKNRP